MARDVFSLVGTLAGRKTSQWLASGAQGCRLNKVHEAAIFLMERGITINDSLGHWFTTHVQPAKILDWPLASLGFSTDEIRPRNSETVEEAQDASNRAIRLYYHRDAGLRVQIYGWHRRFDKLGAFLSVQSKYDDVIINLIALMVL